MKFKIPTVFIASLLALHTNAATLIVSEGQLMGATDVLVEGTFYDVSFVDGTCANLFEACSDFLFENGASFTFGRYSAPRASQALLDQVFIGAYDDTPSLTNGIEDPLLGHVVTPWAWYVGGPGILVVLGSAVHNESAESGIEDSEQLRVIYRKVDWGERSQDVFAVWTPSQPSTVPIPAAAWLFGSALLGLGAIKRKKA